MTFADRNHDFAFDGVVCFGGEDWWYHNRGHYDMQMMRELSAVVPTLYVNSLGMRMPSPREGAMFLRRIRRKLRSLRRGLIEARPNFHVFSPLSIPGPAGRYVTDELLPIQIRSAMRRLGMARPLLWVACPPAAAVIDRVPHSGLVYQRTDRFEAFIGVNSDAIREFDRTLKRSADVVLYCSRLLFEEERDECSRASFIDHGVDYECFRDAGESGASEPADVRSIARPRVGFVGGIDAHTFDPSLLDSVAAACPDLQFVLVGACSLASGWCTHPNVHMLGQRPYEDVAAYMAACDVLIMPWNQSEWIKACNPVKLKEYLAVGRPIVSTWFHEVDRYGDLVRVADGPAQFAREIRAALETAHDPSPGRRRVAEETWSAKAARVLKLLSVNQRVEAQQQQRASLCVSAI